MKNALDNFYLGKLSRREEIQQRMRALQTNGSVIQEAETAVFAYESLTLAQKLELQIQEAKDSKFKVVRNEKSAPYVGDRY
ncbi:hypothetical protein [Pseudomonas sp. WS 5011]|uniref:hypothetical protein n=1 Tax=Pseudomonas sp. WS 5011 TaxID=2717477 RepID=UPI00147421A0|nr:hypothetical protein [Pseudomonas sp. WS 5011]NMY53094.1 hypothetical protein [Pseudomonas sp. WS 5011]